MSVTPGSPGDNTTLTAVLDRLASEGYTDQLVAADGGRIECVHCGRTVAASELEIHEIRRLEGASDPDDMMAVVAATCPGCGARGALILGYGPNASDDDVDIWNLLPNVTST